MIMINDYDDDDDDDDKKHEDTDCHEDVDSWYYRPIA